MFLVKFDFFYKGTQSVPEADRELIYKSEVEFC